MDKVSILMNCFNGEKYVDQALESIFAQTHRNFEVIFVDNCSDDASAEIAARFGRQVKVIKTPEKMSLCRARVFAREFIDGEYFCVLDIDDLMLPKKLERQIEILKNNPRVGAVYSDTIYFTDSGKEVSAYGRKTMPSGDIFSALLSGYFLSLETVMMRTSALREHGLYFNEKYNVSSDMELFTKLAYFKDFYYIPESLTKWRYGHVTESVNQYESFPREYELLLQDLEEMIPSFTERFQREIRSLEGVIYNMYGVVAWKRGQGAEARRFFKKAGSRGKQYYIPYILSGILGFSQYQKLRSVIRKV